MDRNEFRILIKHCYLMGKNTAQARQWLQKCYHQDCPAKSTICRWYAHFKRDQKSIEESERTQSPHFIEVPATETENTQRIKQIIKANGKVRLQDVADEMQMPKECVLGIISDNLNMAKYLSKWVPRSLSVEQRKQRCDISLRCLEVFSRDKDDFLNRYVTMDEMWVHFDTANAEIQSDEEGDQFMECVKTKQTADRVLISIFWDAQGILLCAFLSAAQAANNNYYIAVLDRLDASIKQKRPYMAEKKPLFHRVSDSPIHNTLKSTSKLKHLQYELLPHPEYAPDLSPTDFHMFADLKTALGGKRFYYQDEVIAATEEFIEIKHKSYYKEGIQSLEQRWKDCIAKGGDYIEN